MGLTCGDGPAPGPRAPLDFFRSSCPIRAWNWEGGEDGRSRFLIVDGLWCRVGREPWAGVVQDVGGSPSTPSKRMRRTADGMTLHRAWGGGGDVERIGGYATFARI